MKYEKPKARDLSSLSTAEGTCLSGLFVGPCTGGGVAGDRCESGGTASTSCTTTGLIFANFPPTCSVGGQAQACSSGTIAT